MPVSYVLVPHKDCEQSGNQYLAHSNEPWIELIGDDITRLAGKFAEIKYSASYFDDPLRPIFRFQSASGAVVDHIAPAPVVGFGIWIGRIPPHTTSFKISPTNKAGLFSFRIESCRQRLWLGLIAQGIHHTPRAARSAILTRVIGWRAESDSNLAWAIGSTRPSRYPAWKKKRSRPLDLTTIDIARSDWKDANPIHLWMTIEEPSVDLGLTIASLQGQAFPHWVLHILSKTKLTLPDDNRLRQENTTDGIKDISGLTGRLSPGDELPSYALACLHEISERHPRAQVFYGDEEFEKPDGSLVPSLKPDWDPLLSKQQNICGQSVFLRAPLQNISIEQQREFLTEGKINHGLFDEADRTRIKAIRRILLTTKHLPVTKLSRLAPVFRTDATVAIIIPTKNHAAFLRRAIDSIRLHRGSSKLRLVIVDNGSKDDAAKKLLQDVEADMDAEVIAYPDTFNFSAMCNAGAAAAKSDVLIFLNNDTEVLSEDWLDRLTGWALQKDIGAVGAKLTYPNGNIQHIGVALGMGGSAGHFGSLIDQNAPSWANRSLCVHEVSAVTGACLVVDRLKFEAVGGFDAENFPVELSDIDICLRLAERGWRAIVDPHVHLMHEESGTRGGATFRRLSVYQDQRARFIERWRHVLRDDPHFHPGLSLFHWRETLG